jgi:hypothetical protein
MHKYFMQHSKKDETRERERKRGRENFFKRDREREGERLIVPSLVPLFTTHCSIVLFLVTLTLSQKQITLYPSIAKRHRFPQTAPKLFHQQCKFLRCRCSSTLIPKRRRKKKKKKERKRKGKKRSSDQITTKRRKRRNNSTNCGLFFTCYDDDETLIRLFNTIINPSEKYRLQV